MSKKVASIFAYALTIFNGLFLLLHIIQVRQIQITLPFKSLDALVILAIVISLLSGIFFTSVYELPVVISILLLVAPFLLKPNFWFGF